MLARARDSSLFRHKRVVKSSLIWVALSLVPKEIVILAQVNLVHSLWIYLEAQVHLRLMSVLQERTIV